MPSPARPHPAASSVGTLTPTQLGLRALLIGAMSVAFVTAMLSPAVDGIGGLPGHVLDKLQNDTPSKITKPRPTYSPMQRAALRRTAALVAAREIGVREWPSRDNRGARIVTFRRAVTGAGENPHLPEAWCADFVSWVWRRAGVPIGYGGHGSDSVAVLAGWAQLTGRWHKARGKYHPVKGDLVVYSGYSHIGIITKVAKGKITTVEGNYKSAVTKRPNESARKGEIKGFISPV